MSEQRIESNIQGYGLVFKSVMKDTSIDIEAKALYAYLSSYAGSSSTAFPGVELICGELNISERRFKKYRKQLEDAGYLTVTRKRTSNGFSNNIYHINHALVSGQNSIGTKQHDNNIVSGQNVTLQNVPVQNVSTQNVSEQNVGTKNNSLKNNSLKNNNITNNSTTNDKDVNIDKEEQVVVEQDDKEFASVYKFYTENINPIVNNTTVTFMSDDLKEFGIDLVMYAMEQAALNNITRYAYIQSILKRCKAENIKTRAQAEFKALEKARQRGNYKNNNQSKEMTPEWINKQSVEVPAHNSSNELSEDELEKEREKLRKELEESAREFESEGGIQRHA
ncbi:DnaD domain protein [Macrococcoides canis]|uniref:DnaD domain protein n=1 Tax=Macrococcoides canis TaxID=1855823 RepID=UPI00105F12CC|nr:DnaD domain protein [Macrococcus canis]TDM23798.1 DnaD domain protein [Macrococcus canis]